MFQFNFQVEDDKEKMDSASQVKMPDKKWHKVQCHEFNDAHLVALSEDNTVDEITVGSRELKYLSMASALARIEKNGTSNNIVPVLTENTDLVPAVYEGGLKIWDCSWDLLNYLASSEIGLDGCRVLEVGCGAGLPAIYAMRHGAHISLQDYNEEVINYITIPNVLLNTVDISMLEGGDPATFEKTLNDVKSKACFYSGDWGELNSFFTDETKGVSDIVVSSKGPSSIARDDHKFDLILTSETIYNPECHEKLLLLLTNHIKPEGKILLAAKSVYFGVGGGVLQFCDLVKSKGQLDVKTVFTDDRGVKREILEMKLKSR